jgi:DNA-directed RNA polymerase specialized sigma24 family protein
MALPNTVKIGRKMATLEARLADAREERNAAIVERRAEGVTLEQIAAEVGLSRQQVHTLVRKAS